MKKGIIVVAVVVVVGIVAVVAAQMMRGGTMNDMNMSGGNASTSTDTSDAVATDKVDIKNFSYEPKVITVKKGTTVTWTNQDTVEHTVTTQKGAPESFDSKLFGKGETYSHTFTKAGTYEYYCIPHPYMKATIVVTE